MKDQSDSSDAVQIVAVPQHIQFLFWDLIFKISSLLNPDISHKLLSFKTLKMTWLRLRFIGAEAVIFLAAAPS